MRRNGWLAVICFCVGGVALAAALLTETPLDGGLSGLAGAGFGMGLVQLGRWLYGRKPLCGFHLLVTVLAMVVFTILGSFELVEGSRTVVLYLGGYLALQLVAATVVYDRLLKKYTE